MEISARFDHGLEQYLTHLRAIERLLCRSRGQPGHGDSASERC